MLPMTTETIDQRIAKIKERCDSLPRLGKKKLLAQVRLKKLLKYSGPDPKLQEASLTALGSIIGYTPWGVHREIIRHQNLTQFGGYRDQDMVLAFRGLGKSSYGHYVRAISYVLRDFDTRILLSSDTMTAAVDFHKETSAHLMYNPILTGLFGEFYPRGEKSVTTNERGSKIVQRKNKTIKEGTFTCLGIGNQAASRHFDVVFCDDLVTQEKSRTPAMRKKLYDWYGSTLVGTWVPGTKVHHIGTRYYPNDLWETLEIGTEDQKQEGGPLQRDVLRIPIYREDEFGGQIATHPERYPDAIIKARLASMGRYHFNAQMMQDTKSGEGIIFKYQDFRWYGRSEKPAELNIFCFFDLAAKQTETGAYFAGVTIGIDNERKNIYFLDVFRERAGMARQREMIYRTVDKWKPIQAGVEAVQMQAGFAEEIQESGINPVIPVPCEADKVFRAQRIVHLVETGRVFFPADENMHFLRDHPAHWGYSAGHW